LIASDSYLQATSQHSSAYHTNFSFHEHPNNLWYPFFVQSFIHHSIYIHPGMFFYSFLQLYLWHIVAKLVNYFLKYCPLSYIYYIFFLLVIFVLHSLCNYILTVLLFFFWSIRVCVITFSFQMFPHKLLLMNFLMFSYISFQMLSEKIKY